MDSEHLGGWSAPLLCCSTIVGSLTWGGSATLLFYKRTPYIMIHTHSSDILVDLRRNVIT